LAVKNGAADGDGRYTAKGRPEADQFS
jgi:hypothetical protein